MTGDEVVFGKAGKETYGLGRFFYSLQNRVILGLSFFVFSLIDVQERQAYPIQAVQMVKEPKKQEKKEREKPVRLFVFVKMEFINFNQKEVMRTKESVVSLLLPNPHTAGVFKSPTILEEEECLNVRPFYLHYC